MGCDCCKNINPKDYNSCKIANHKSFKGIYFAPCGADFNSF